MITMLLLMLMKTMICGLYSKMQDGHQNYNVVVMGETDVAGWCLWWYYNAIINADEDDDDLCPQQQDAKRSHGLQPGGSGQDGLWQELGV